MSADSPFNDFDEEQPGDHLDAEELFGNDGLEDEGVIPAAQEPSPTPAPASLPANDAAERRKALLQLARKQQAQGDEPKKKKQKRDKQAANDGSRQQRSKRQRAGSGTADKQSRQQQQQHEEIPEEEVAVETDADRRFIDDEGVPEDERYEEDEEALAAAQEAEEAQPGDEDLAEPTSILDEVLMRRKRARRRGDDAEVDAEVMSLVSMMQACAEKDAAAMESKPPQPAIEKLKALAEVGRILRQRKYHESFLATKGLNALAAWLRPYHNGVLPNGKIRSELVSHLQLLQLDTTNDYIRERLEESELGKIIMFYFKNPNESMSLRSACRDLIQAWSAPIFADQDEEQRKRRQRERAHRQRQLAERAERERREKQEQEEADRRRKLSAGQEGFRARAAVPQPSRMDFVINPGSKLDPLEASLQGAGGAGTGAGPGKANKSPIGGRLGKVLQQRKRGARDRIGGMSIEGRGIQL